MRGCPWLHWSTLGHCRNNVLSVPNVQLHAFQKQRGLKIRLGTIAQPKHKPSPQQGVLELPYPVRARMRVEKG